MFSLKNALGRPYNPKGRFGLKRLGTLGRNSLRVLKHWHKMPTASVAVPSLEVPKTRLDSGLSKLV